MLLCVLEDAGNASGVGGPAGGFSFELFAAGWRDRVDAGSALLFGHGPLGGDPAGFLHAVEGWVERTFLDLQRFGGQIVDGISDGVAVECASAIEDGEDEEVDGSLR